ncbi:MAG: Ig-like domain-containing protein [Pseudomonadota bacterium]
MSRKSNQTGNPFFTLFPIVVLLWTLTGCGSDSASDNELDTHTVQTGSISFRVKWGNDPDATPSSLRKAQSPSGDVCIDYAIETVAAAVYNSEDQSLVTASFPCSSHSGVMNKVPVGSGMRLMVEGLVGPDVLWRGELSDITVTAGQTQPVGDVVVLYIGGDSIPPAITGQIPTPDATGVDPATAVAVIFSEPIVPASANSTSINIAVGDTRIPASVAYDNNTKTATLTPASPLSFSTVYTATVTTDIEDLAANRPARPQTWRFTTRHLSFTAEAGSGGTISPGGQMEVVAGTNQTYTITPDPGYYLSELLVDGAAVTPSLAYTFASTDANHTIAARFRPVWYVDGERAVNGGGRTWADAFNTVSAAIIAAEAGEDIWIRKGNYIPASEVAVSRAVSIYGGFNGDENFLHQRNPQNNPTVLDGNAAIRIFTISAAARLDGLSFRNGSIMGGNGSGGSIYNSADALITGCTFRDNTVYMYGGAIYNANCSPTISDCIFENNITSGSTSGYGGAIYNQQGSGTISHCRFIDNTAGIGAFSAYGGAIYNSNANPDISNCYFLDNGTGGEGGYGGGIYNDGGAPSISGCIFSRNRVNGVGGGQGAAVYNKTTGAAILNCTFWGNTAYANSGDSYGGAVYNTDTASSITNSILWGNWATIGTQMHNAGAMPEVSYCNIDQDGFTGSNGNIRKEPRLNADGHLRSDSPCIDQGLAAPPAYDIDTEPIPPASADMGADEFIDTDGDGMPDYWEKTYSLNPSADDANDDNDGDELSNAEEYAIGSDPTRANPVIDASNRGWWRNDGFHNQDDNSTIVGRIYDNINYVSRFYRSYFSFDLSGVTGSVASAVLRIEVVDYNTINPSETVKIYDVSTSAALLEANAVNRTDIYTDIGSGTLYGSHILSLADRETVIQTQLERVNLNTYLGSYFSIGIASDTLSEPDQIVRFSQGSEIRTHQLVLIME